MSEESVSRIHGRFYLTLINPSSYVTSLIIGSICLALIIILINTNYLAFDPVRVLYSIPLSLLLFYASIMVDHMLLRSTPLSKLSKVFHTAAFTMIIWLITIALGIVSVSIFQHERHNYIIEGVFLITAFRLCIFTSVFGASKARASMIAPILPLLLLFSILPEVSVDPTAIMFGSVLLAIAVSWIMLADRAGRPKIKSTFRLLQAYLLAWTEKDARIMEDMMEDRAKDSIVSTYTILLDGNKGSAALIIPDIHPGPFYPVGGSNLPFELSKFYADKATSMVMHSISDHALNLPSKQQVMNYIEGLSSSNVIDSGEVCSEPVIIQVNRARVTGLAFGKVSMLMLSLSPHGMEDLPEEVRSEVERYASSRGFKHTLIVDTHNAMGDHLSDQDQQDMISACKVALDELIRKPQSRFRVGSAHLNNSKADIGPAGLSVVAISVNDRVFTLGWADSNNMERGLRERIISYLSNNGINMVELCTSDTHYTSGGARNRTGYFTLGSVSNATDLCNWYLELAKLSIKRLSDSRYSLLNASSKVKVMGMEQFDDYSHALDRSLNITKISLGITVAVYIAMLLAG